MKNEDYMKIIPLKIDYERVRNVIKENEKLIADIVEDNPTLKDNMAYKFIDNVANSIDWLRITLARIEELAIITEGGKQ